MALPVITNNSPAAGSIAWTAFNVSWADQDWPIAAGNTNKKFVWWEYRNGVPATVTGDALPTFAAGDCILFLNKNGVGACVPLMEIQDGSLLVPGSILAASIAADQIQSYHVQADAINAGHIQAGSIGATEIAAGAISANHISAGAITAEKLSVGTVGDNMVVNGSFEDALSGTLVGWEAYTLSNGTITPVTGVASSGAVSIQFDATSTSANLRMRQLPAQYIPVSSASGRKYYVSVRAGSNVATTSGHYQRVNWYDANKVFISSNDIRSNGALSTTFTLYEGQVTPPSTARYMGMEVIVTNINTVAKVYIDEVTAHEVTMSAQIGDGQVTAAKILAGTITGDRIAAGTITAAKMLMGDMTNMAADGDFTDTTKANWTGSGTIVTSTTEPNKLRIVTAASGNNDQANANRFNVVPGDVYYGEMYVYGAVTNVGAGGPNLHLTITKDDGTTTWPSFQSLTRAAVQGVWTKLSGTVTIPANARFAKAEAAISYSADAVGNTYDIRNVKVRRMNGGELIVDGSITAQEIAANTITANEIAANAITASELAADAVTAGKILAGSIGTNHMTANTINGDRILANTIAADKILANSIGAGQIAANSITGQEIAAGTITADEIGANAIISEKIAALSIGADKIIANSITAGQLAANTITANELAADAVTANAIEATAIDGMTITGATLQTDAAANTGVKISADGILAYDAGSVESFNLDAATGNLTATGTFQTSASGQRVKLSDRPTSQNGTPIAAMDLYADTTLQHGAFYTENVNGTYITNIRHFTSDSASPGIFQMKSDGTWYLGGPAGSTSGAIWNYANGDVQVNQRFVADRMHSVGDAYVGGNTTLQGDLTVSGIPLQVTPWTTLSLASGWSAYVGGGGYFGGLRYRREGPNFRIQGMVKTAGSAPSIIATLPFQCAYTDLIHCVAGNATTTRSVAYVVISQNGQITYDSGLSNISFVSIDHTIPWV